MSGIVARLRFDGQALAPAELAGVCKAMRFRGPDGGGHWQDGSIGLGLTQLRTHPREAVLNGPLTLANQYWLVADARLDARENLISRLHAAGQEAHFNDSCARLILRAYAAWHEDCVLHLQGDFVFALWDAQQQQLFAARDPLGVKSALYALNGRGIVFGNTAAGLLACEQVSRRPNERALAESFLLVVPQSETETSFADLQRLPPGHVMSVRQGGEVAIRRYWSMPDLPGIRGRSADDLMEEFRSLLLAAVSDRLAGECAHLQMSGGLDSTAVAAAARHCGVSQLHAYTDVYEELIDDDEEQYARSAAEHLGINLHVEAVDQYIWDNADDAVFRDSAFPLTAAPRFHHPAVRDKDPASRVLLTGQGGDPALEPSLSDLRRELRSWRAPGLLLQIMQYRLQEGRFPPLRLRRVLGAWVGKPDEPPPFPRGLAEDRVEQYGLRELWFSDWESRRGRQQPAYGFRSEARSLLSCRGWQGILEAHDAGQTGAATEYRHPWLDLRLLRFLLALPSLPWCADKQITRRSMRGWLPESILQRPKTPLSAYPLYEALIRDPGRARSELEQLAEPMDSSLLDTGYYRQMTRNIDKILPEEYDALHKIIRLHKWQQIQQ